MPGKNDPLLLQLAQMKKLPPEEPQRPKGRGGKAGPSRARPQLKAEAKKGGEGKGKEPEGKSSQDRLQEARGLFEHKLNKLPEHLWTSGRKEVEMMALWESKRRICYDF